MNQQNEDLSGENDRFSDIEFSLDEDDLIGQPISSAVVDLTSSEVPDLISKDNKICTLSIIHEESNCPVSRNVSLDSSRHHELSDFDENKSYPGSGSISLVSSRSVKSSNSRNSNNYTSAKSGGSSESLKSSSSYSGRSSRGRCSSEKNNQVLESINKLKNVSLNESGSGAGRPDSRTPVFSRNSHITNNDTKEKNRVRINSVHQSVGSSFFNQNSTTDSRNSNHGRNSVKEKNQNSVNEKNQSSVNEKSQSFVREKNQNTDILKQLENSSIDQLQNMLADIRKNSTQIKVNEDEVSLSSMKSFELLNNIIDSTLDVLAKDHFNYLNENQAFFEMTPGFLAQHIPESIDFKSLDKPKSESKIFDDKTIGEQTHSKSASVLFFP